MLLYVLGFHGEVEAQDGMRGDEAATIYRSGSPLLDGDLKGQDVLAFSRVPLRAPSKPAPTAHRLTATPGLKKAQGSSMAILRSE